MKAIYMLLFCILLCSPTLFAAIHINFEMVVGVRMGPSDSCVEGAAHFKPDREFIIETEFPDGVVRETGTYSYNPEKGELVLKYNGPKGIVKFNVVSSNGIVKLLMVNRVAEAPAFILELLYGTR